MQGKLYADDAAAAFGVADVEAAAVLEDDLVAHGKTYAAASVFGTAFIKLNFDVGKLIDRDAPTVVPYVDGNVAVACRHPRLNKLAVAAVLARSLVAATKELPVKAIVFDTYTGRVGRYLSTFRPEVPMYALCYSAHTMRELALVRGVEPIMITRTATKEEFVQKAIETLQQRGYVKQGDLIGYIGGDFGSQIGATYMEFKYVA